MYYNYFVSYSFENGFGNATVTLDHKIESYKDIQEVARMLQGDSSSEIIILYWRRIKFGGLHG